MLNPKRKNSMKNSQSIYNNKENDNTELHCLNPLFLEKFSQVKNEKILTENMFAALQIAKIYQILTTDARNFILFVKLASANS